MFLIATILLHVIALLEPPQTIFKAMDRTFSDFLWKHDSSSADRTWRAWDHLVFP